MLYKTFFIYRQLNVTHFQILLKQMWKLPGNVKHCAKKTINAGDLPIWDVQMQPNVTLSTTMKLLYQHYKMVLYLDLNIVSVSLEKFTI